MSGIISTGTTAIAADGTIYQYAPPNMTPVTIGKTVTNGSYQQVQAGSQWPPNPGVWQVGNGSGASAVTATLTYRVVTIVPLPSP